MPAHPFQTSFGSGELTERLGARIDFAKYAQGAACLRNFAVHVHGGASKRAGTTFIQATKDSGAFQADTFQEDAFDVATGQTVTRLVPFEFSPTQAYMTEWGQQYIRIYKDRAPLLDALGAQVTIATTYNGGELRQLRFVQSADVKYIAHQSHPPRKLSRVTTTSFTLTDINFLPPPTTEIGILPDATLTLSALTGSGVTVAASNPIFQSGDVDRLITSGGSRAVISTFTDASHVVVDIVDAFTSLTVAAGAWTLEGSPSGTLTPSAKEPLHKVITLTGSLDAFRATDVGKYVLVHSGVVKITTYTSATVVSGEIQKVLTAITAAPAGAWTLEEPAWSEDRGYPGVVALFGQRLYWAGTPTQPDTIWGSVVGDYENHGQGADDDDAVEFVIAQEKVNTVRWIKSLKQLLIGTVGGELDAHGSSDSPITPSAITVDEHSQWGADFDVDAVRVGNVVLFLQRGGRKLREMAFSFEEDGYRAPDLSILAEHLLREGIVEMAHLSQPDSTLLSIRADGTLLAMTYERPEQVVAWSHHVTEGEYVSVAVLPNSCGTGDEVWVVVERNFATAEAAFQTNAFQGDAFQISGPTMEARRHIEVFDGALTTDSALTWSGTDKQDTFAIPHLETARVAALWDERAFQEDTFQDDLVQGPIRRFSYHTVLDGLITLSEAVDAVQIGQPYEAHVQLLKPELQLQSGSMQGRRQRYSEILLRLFCTDGTPTVNGQAIVYPVEAGVAADDPSGTPVGGYTGDVRITKLGWTRGERVIIAQPDPVPMTLLGVGGSIQSDDG